MKITIKYKGNTISVNDDFHYSSYIDVRNNAIKIITETIKSIDTVKPIQEE